MTRWVLLLAGCVATQPAPTRLDRDAARTVFEFPPGPAGLNPAGRQVLELAGPWQIVRFDEQPVRDRTGPVASIPDDRDALPWTGIRVPGDKAAERPDLTDCHRLLYRTRVRVPATFAGRAFTLRLANVALSGTVFVNGRRCGFGDTPGAAFDCDVTPAVRLGEVNEIVVAVKDRHYARVNSSDPAAVDYPVLASDRNGLLEAPILTASGPQFVADVFVQPSVARKEVGVEVTVRNAGPSTARLEVALAVRPLESRGTPAKTFTPQAVEVPAGGVAVVKVREPWGTARPWWPDDPQLYAVETRLVADGRPVDESLTPFGFREWGWDGGRVTLNGVPYSLRGVDRSAAALSVRTARDWQRLGQTFTRYAGDRPWADGTQADTLFAFDRGGMPVLRSLPLDRNGSRYKLDDPQVSGRLFANWRRQLGAQIRAERNHPSVIGWAVEPGLPSRFAGELAAVAELANTLDPTRPVFVENGLGVNPRVVPMVRAGGRGLISGVRPQDRFPPELFASVGGGAVRVQSLERLLVAGYRWAGGAGFELADPPADTTFWQPVCVLARERTDTLPAGGTVSRVLKVVNDTRFTSPITAHWLLQTKGGKVSQVRGKRTFAPKPGGAEEFVVELAVPAAGPGQTLDAVFVLTAERDGREVFRDVQSCHIRDSRPKPVDEPPPGG